MSTVESKKNMLGAIKQNAGIFCAKKLLFLSRFLSFDKVIKFCKGNSTILDFFRLE